MRNFIKYLQKKKEYCKQSYILLVCLHKQKKKLKCLMKV